MIGVDVKGGEVFRLFLSRDPKTGAKRQPFMHSSVPAPSADHPEGGRFDLRSPRGTCYLSSARLGAWVEVFRGARMVDRRDARSRRMLQSRVPRRLVLADATSRSAIADGVALDLHSGSNRIDINGSRPPSMRIRHFAASKPGQGMTLRSRLTRSRSSMTRASMRRTGGAGTSR